MPVTILSHHFARPEPVDSGRIIDTIEKNRDRIRITANMIITLSGILISFCSTFVFFIAKEKLTGIVPILLFISGASTFLLSATLGISSTYLRVSYAVLDEPQFVSDLLHRYHSELRLLRFATAVLVIGLLLIVAGAISFAIVNR